jgi:hypothetical protein
MSGIFENMTLKRKSRNSNQDFNSLNESDCYDSNLLKVLRKFIKSINPKEIYNFLYENSQLNIMDLKFEEAENEYSEYSEIIKIFIEFGSSGYDFEYFNDEDYFTKKDEFKQKLNEIKGKCDFESINFNFEIDILNEEDESKIICALLLSLVSYINNEHSENVYECLIRLRRYIEGNIRKFDILLEFEIATIIVRSIEISRIKRVYIAHLIYKMLSDIKNK